MGKRNFVEKGMTQNMERINRGQISEDRKPEVKWFVKEWKEAGRGKRDKARTSDPIKYLKPLHFFTMLNV